MGYEIRITREISNPDNPITKSEWRSYVENHPEFKWEDKLEGINPKTGERITLNQEVVLYESVDFSLPLSFFRGEISVKNPDTDIIEVMKSIAKSLNAQVIGDDGEIYE